MDNRSRWRLAVGRPQGIKAKTFYTAYQGNIYGIAVPLVHEGTVLGVISIGRAGSGNTFTRDEREVVAGGALIADMALGQLHKNVTAEERAEDRFAGGELQPHIRRAEMQPAFGKEIDNLRAEERADSGERN